MSNVTNYGSRNYLPKARPGMTWEDKASDYHIIASFNEGIETTIVPSIFTGNFWAVTNANANQTIQLTYRGIYNEVVTDQYVIPNTGFDPRLFSNWISTVLAGSVNFANTQNWGTASNVDVTLVETAMIGASNTSPTLTIVNIDTAVTFTQVFTGLPQVRIQPGVIVVRNVAVDSSTKLRNQNYLHSYKVIDSAATSAQLLADGGVTELPNLGYSNNLLGLNSTGLFDRISVLKQGRIYVATSTTATFNLDTGNADALLVETAAGPNRGKVTNVPSATTLALPSAHYQNQSARIIAGGILINVTCG